MQIANFVLSHTGEFGFISLHILALSKDIVSQLVFSQYPNYFFF